MRRSMAAWAGARESAPWQAASTSTPFARRTTVSVAARDVLFPLLVARVFGPRYLAAIYGFLMISYFPGGGLGPIVLARAHDVLGSYELGFGLCAALIGAAAIALLTISQLNEADSQFRSRFPRR